MGHHVYDLAVIGAGAAGLMAAITAARAGVQVILLEHMEQPGRKILATGNGRCNYTNADQGAENYFCPQSGFVDGILEQFSLEETITFFEKLGIRPVYKYGTWIYPESEQAHSVWEALLSEVSRLGIPVVVSLGIRGITKSQGLFMIETKAEPYYSRACILATGGKAAKRTGSDGSGYIYAEKLGHRIIKPLPALVALRTEDTEWRLPAGVRIRCGASLLLSEGDTYHEVAFECGELQITDYGISGIVIFQLSRIASKALDEGKQVWVNLDFKQEQSGEDLYEYLLQRLHSDYLGHKSIDKSLVGFVPDRLIPALTRRAGLSPDQTAGECTKEQIQHLCQIIKSFRVRITGTKTFDEAQVTCGGVDTAQLHPQTLESRLVEGLFFAGEIVDVDGKCGGYNLQWAWSSGAVAGWAAIMHIEKQEREYDTHTADQTSTEAQ